MLDADCELIEAKLMLARLALEEQGIHNYMEKEITVQKEEPVYKEIEIVEWVDGKQVVVGTNLVKVGTKMVDVGETIKVPLDDEHASEYMTKLVAYCEEQEKAGNPDFKNFTKTMDELEAMFKKVAVEAAKEGASSPFYAYDSYWDMYFNYQTQSYYFRAGYYANCDTQLKRSYNLLATYYNIPAHQESYKALTDVFSAGVKAIESRKLGRNPSDGPSGRNEPNGSIRRLTTYSPTLKLNLYKVGEVTYQVYPDGRPNQAYYKIDEDNMKEYMKRLHGQSIADDLISAGMLSKGSYLLTETIGLGYDCWGPYDTGYNWKKVNYYKGFRVKYYDWEGNTHQTCYYDTDPGDSDHNFKYWANFDSTRPYD